MNSTNTSDADLAGVRARLSEQILSIEETIRPLQEQLSRLKAQAELIERALQVGSGNEHQDALPADNKVAKQNVADRVFDLLREAAGPLHVSEILRQYVARGFTVPGQGNESNLLVYIVRDPRFVRVSKGTYAIAQSGSVPAPSVRPKARKRRRKKAKE